MRVVWLAVLFGVVMVSGAVRAGQAPLRLVLGDKTERPFWHAGTHRFGTEKFVFGFLAEPFDSSSAVAVRDRKIDRVLAPDIERAVALIESGELVAEAGQ